MKFDPIKNPNYVATIIRVAALEDLEGLDNLRGLRVFGMQALVGKDTQVGDLGVLFSTEVQLSEDFARLNNLHRRSNLNADPTKTGYLEDNRRVKAIKLRGHRSDSLFIPLADVRWPHGDTDPSKFNVGDTFDSINGHEILRKYVIKEPKPYNGPKANVRRVDLKVFPLHVDSENYWRNSEKIPSGAPVVVTQKLHGTSVRYGKVPVAEPRTWFQRLKSKLGISKVETFNKYRFVVGSRMVVKSIDYKTEQGKNHYYATDLWTEYAHKHGLHELIPDGFLVYGELVGYLPNGKPIQQNYTYDLPEGEADLYVYRVATVTESGAVTDLSWPATRAFAHGIGLKTVPEFGTVLHEDLVVDEWMDRNYHDDWSKGMYLTLPDTPVPLSDEDTVDEGICVRYDGPNGIYILKAKSPIFLGHETAMLDAGAEDVESGEATDG